MVFFPIAMLVYRSVDFGIFCWISLDLSNLARGLSLHHELVAGHTVEVKQTDVTKHLQVVANTPG